MNTIDIFIQELNKSLTNLWKEHTTSSERANEIFSDFYDFVITLSFMQIIPDSRLAMDILHFYNHYKRFRYVDPSKYSQYYTEEKNAKADLLNITNQLLKL